MTGPTECADRPGLSLCGQIPWVDSMLTNMPRRDDLELIECQVSADASDVLFVETAMIYQDQIKKWEAQHPGR